MLSHFFWENEHTLGFEKIKELLASNFSNTEGKTKNAVNIIYIDSSLHLMGALLFSCYSTENINSSPPDNLVDLDSVFHEHLNHY